MSGSDDASLLPPKRDVALALVQTATSVFIHLDPRGAEVLVPSWFKNQPELVLQVGLNLVPPIVDLDIGADALSATLSFNRRPEFCKIPWSAIWGLVGDDGRGMIWPESVPPEVAARAPGRASGAGKAGSGKSGSGKAGGGKVGSGKVGSGQVGAGKATGPARKGAGHLRAAGPSSDPAKPSEATSAPATLNEATSAPAESAQEAKSTDESLAPSAAPRKRELPPYLRIVK